MEGKCQIEGVNTLVPLALFQTSLITLRQLQPTLQGYFFCHLELSSLPPIYDTYDIYEEEQTASQWPTSEYLLFMDV